MKIAVASVQLEFYAHGQTALSLLCLHLGSVVSSHWEKANGLSGTESQEQWTILAVLLSASYTSCIKLPCLRNHCTNTKPLQMSRKNLFVSFFFLNLNNLTDVSQSELIYFWKCLYLFPHLFLCIILVTYAFFHLLSIISLIKNQNDYFAVVAIACVLHSSVWQKLICF